MANLHIDFEELFQWGHNMHRSFKSIKSGYQLFTPHGLAHCFDEKRWSRIGFLHKDMVFRAMDNVITALHSALKDPPLHLHYQGLEKEVAEIFYPDVNFILPLNTEGGSRVGWVTLHGSGFNVLCVGTFLSDQMLLTMRKRTCREILASFNRLTQDISCPETKLRRAKLIVDLFQPTLPLPLV
jgi:hypothetical protein